MAYEWKMVMDSTNKPYGWVKNGEYVLYIDKPDSVFNYRPLYTHPAKTLTDEYCKAYWGKDNCFVDVFLPNSETEVIRFWNDQLNESYKPKTLTDGEIVRISETCDLNHVLGLIDFANAILRKAQAEIESLKAEKIRAYDNGYEDGRKPNTNKAQE